MKILVSKWVPDEPTGGFSVSVEVDFLAGNRVPSLFEYHYKNPGEDWHVEMNVGATIGSAGPNKGLVAYSPTWEQLAIAGGYKIALMGIKEGAELKMRHINFVPEDQYPNYGDLYAAVKDDPSKWAPFSNSITVPAFLGKGKKK